MHPVLVSLCMVFLKLWSLHLDLASPMVVRQFLIAFRLLAVQEVDFQAPAQQMVSASCLSHPLEQVTQMEARRLRIVPILLVAKAADSLALARQMVLHQFRFILMEQITLTEGQQAVPIIA